MARYFVPLSQEEFLEKLHAYLQKMARSIEPVEVESTKPLIQMIGLGLYNVIQDGRGLAKFQRDVSKIEFDWENIDCDPADDGDMQHWLGPQVLSNGMPFWGIMAGGDWENPVHMILYFDGKDFRGYIPTRGNTFNEKTKQAFGNDEDADAEEALRRGFETWDDIQPNLEEMRADILKRIVQA